MSCSTASPRHRDLGPAAATRRARRLTAWALLAAALAAGGTACRSVAPAPALGAAELAAAVDALGRPLPGELAALYHLRVPASGSLRLAMLGDAEAGRMTVSEPFGSAASVSAWSAGSPSRFFDLRRGCRMEASGVSSSLGVSAMPLPQAILLLGGRLPAADGDRVMSRDDGRLEVVGAGWRALVTVAAEPWRVVEVVEVAAAGSGWRVRLDDHSGSLPGRVRVDGRDGGWAELDLVRLEWEVAAALPAEPDLPDCE